MIRIFLPGLHRYGSPDLEERVDELGSVARHVPANRMQINELCKLDNTILKQFLSLGHYRIQHIHCCM